LMHSSNGWRPSNSSSLEADRERALEAVGLRE
jgi:hypothetical protein